MTYLWLSCIVLYMPLTILIGKYVGEKRKIGYSDTVIISLFASPIVALIAALSSPLIYQEDESVQD